MIRSKYAVACVAVALLPGSAHPGQWQEFSGVTDFSNPELYDFYPYRDYRTNGSIGFPLTTAEPDLDRFHPKATVLGICRNSAAKSYPFDDMPDGAVINDDIGGDRIVVVFDRDLVQPSHFSVRSTDVN